MSLSMISIWSGRFCRIGFVLIELFDLKEKM